MQMLPKKAKNEQINLMKIRILDELRRTITNMNLRKESLMNRWQIRAIQEQDYKTVVDIYNSNPAFLSHHLGTDSVDEIFIANEMRSMKEVNFSSCVIMEEASGEPIGILDFKYSDQCYLSLLMLSAEYQQIGLGREVYNYFEILARENNSSSIRIDVVNDYPDNVVPFWEKLGFKKCETEQLTWGNKVSSAIVMRKQL